MRRREKMCRMPQVQRRILKLLKNNPTLTLTFRIEICNRNRQFILEFRTIVTPHTMSGRKRNSSPPKHMNPSRKNESPQAMRHAIRQMKLLAQLNTGDKPFTRARSLHFKDENFNQLNLALMDFAVELISIEFCLLSLLHHQSAFQVNIKKRSILDTFPVLSELTSNSKPKFNPKSFVIVSK